MFYILYQVTNNVNGKIYVGVHKTKKLDDGYMGSGKVITSAIAKYGVENFTRIILEQFGTSTAMYAREKEVVNEEFLAREDTYNLRRGGSGGFDYINKKELHYVGYNSAAERNRAISPFADNSKFKIDNFVEQRKIWASKAGKRSQELGHSFTAEINKEMSLRSLSLTARKKRKDTLAKIGHAQGEKNSQFGSKWITNEVSNKKIKKDDPVPEGWRAGRVIK